MNTLLLTCAGRSERFEELGGAKWSLRWKTGRSMASHVLDGVNREVWPRVLVAVNDADLRRFGGERGVRAIIDHDVEVVWVGTPPTRRDTIARALRGEQVGALYVRDCDTLFDGVDVAAQNAIVCGDSRKHALRDRAAFSYVLADDTDRIRFASEHKIGTARWFVAGGYVFESWHTARPYVLTHEHLADAIGRMVADGHSFRKRAIVHFTDWGDADAWKASLKE